MKEQTEPLIKLQTKEYIEFVRNFNESVAIMNKKFFIVVPYTGGAISTGSGSSTFSGLFGGKTASDRTKDALVEFEEKRTQLEQRIGIISTGLLRIGVRTAQLDTEAVVELLYKTFNPGEISSAIKVENLSRSE